MPLPFPFLTELLANSPQLAALGLVVVVFTSTLWLIRPELVDMALGVAQLGFDKANAKLSFDFGKICDSLAGKFDDPLDLQGMRQIRDIKGKASPARTDPSEQLCYWGLELEPSWLTLGNSHKMPGPPILVS
jgi:hypothetical protein